MAKFTMTVSIDFDDEDGGINLGIAQNLEGDLNPTQTAMAVFFKDAITVTATHSANQTVDYGSMVQALVDAQNGEDWDD